MHISVVNENEKGHVENEGITEGERTGFWKTVFHEIRNT